MKAILERRVSFFLRQPGRLPLILGHRGSPQKAPENTLASYQCAWDEGADGVELDVRMSRDRQLILSHDDTIHTPDLQGPTSLSRLTLAEIQKLPPRDGHSIPTLGEALALKRDTKMALNIELKADRVPWGSLVEETAALIDKWGGDKILLSSFSPFILRRLRKRLPDVPSVLLFEERVWWQRLVFPLTSLRVQGANPCEKFLNRELVEELRSQGSLIGTWTVNDEARAKELADLGVDILITDLPSRIISALQP